MHDVHGRTDVPFLALGQKAAGRIAAAGDRRWFAVALEVGRAYIFSLTFDGTQNTSPQGPCPLAVYGATGVDLADAALAACDGRGAWRVTLTASHSGPHHVAVGGHPGDIGGFELRVDQAAPDVPVSGLERLRAPVVDLGDITEFDDLGWLTRCRPEEVETAVCFRFGLTRTRRVAFGLDRDGTPARMRLMDGGGHTVRWSDGPGEGGEWVSAALFAGAWFLRVQSDPGDGFLLRYRVSGLDSRPKMMPDSRPRTSAGLTIQDGAAVSARHFQLFGGNEDRLFEVHELSGEVFLIGAEEDIPRGTAEFELTVRASDGTGFTDHPVGVAVTNLPDEAFEATAATRVSLGRVSGPHPQGLPLRYVITAGNEAGLYDLDERTGELFMVGSPEERATEPDLHELKIQVLLDRH